MAREKRRANEKGLPEMSHLSGKITIPSQGITSWERCQDGRADLFIHPDNGEIGTIIGETHFCHPNGAETVIASLVRYTKTYQRATTKGFQSGVRLEYKIQSNYIHPNPQWFNESIKEIHFHNERVGLTILEKYSIDGVLKILGAKSLVEGDRLWMEASGTYLRQRKLEMERREREVFWDLEAKQKLYLSIFFFLLALGLGGAILLFIPLLSPFPFL